MNKISTPIRLIYYLLLNKGKVAPTDKEAVELRMKLPFTITVGNANGAIKKLLGLACEAAEVEPKETEVKIRKFDWCYFGRQPQHKLNRISTERRPVYVKPLKKSNFKNGVFRRK